MPDLSPVKAVADNPQVRNALLAAAAVSGIALGVLAAVVKVEDSP